MIILSQETEFPRKAPRDVMRNISKSYVIR